MLENSNCTFKNKFYRQVSRTSVGTIFAPTYAALTMGYSEVHFCNIEKLKWKKNSSRFYLRN